MSPRKPASQELTREMIMKEASVQFLEKDYHKVSMRGIAKELGCSHGAIYYHFKNKAELFYGIVEESFVELNRRIDETVISDEDHLTKLNKLFLGFMEFGLNNQNQYKFMFMIRNNEVNGLSHEATNLSYQKYAQAIQSLSMKNIMAKDIYSAFIALHGFVSLYLGLVNNYQEAKEAAQIHADFIIKALVQE